MSFCNSCGIKLIANAKFCQACGALVENLKTNEIHPPVPVETEKMRLKSFAIYSNAIILLHLFSLVAYRGSADLQHFRLNASADEIEFMGIFLIAGTILSAALMYWLVVAQALKKGKPNFALYGAIIYGVLSFFGVAASIPFREYNFSDWLGLVFILFLIGLMVEVWVQGYKETQN